MVVPEASGIVRGWTKKMAEAEKGVQCPQRSAERSPQALREPRKTLANVSGLKPPESVHFSNSHPFISKG